MLHNKHMSALIRNESLLKQKSINIIHIFIKQNEMSKLISLFELFVRRKLRHIYIMTCIEYIFNKDACIIYDICKTQNCYYIEQKSICTLLKCLKLIF